MSSESEPVTKKEFNDAMRAVQQSLQAVHKQMADDKKEIMHHLAKDKKEIMHHLAKDKKEIMHHLAKDKKEITHHFDVVAENIHKDVAGANKDEILSIKDRQKDHEVRITKLERVQGIRA